MKLTSSKAFTFFDPDTTPAVFAAEVGDLNETTKVAESIRERVDLNQYFKDSGCLRPMLVHEEPDGYSLLEAEWAPNFVVPRHYHDNDQVVYVVAGEIYLGRRRLGPGSGFFLPAGQPYGYTAGPEGARVLEFRHAPRYETFFVETDPDRWAVPAAGSPAAAAAGSVEVSA